MDENKIKEIVEQFEVKLTQNKNLDDTPANNNIKMLMYKFFFFNYVFQVTGPDIMESLISGEPEDPLRQFGRDFPPILKPHEMTQA